jgi:hypothetical protein
MFTASKREDIRLLKEVIVICCTVAAIASSYAYGLYAVSLAMFVVGLIDFLVTTFLLKRYLKLHLGEYLVSMTHAFWVTLSCVTVAYVFGLFVHDTSLPAYLYVFFLAISAGATWLVSNFALDTGCHNEIKRMIGK